MVPSIQNIDNEPVTTRLTFNDIDNKYDGLMVILNYELLVLMKNVDELEKNTSQMDDFNAYYGDDETFGYHEQPNLQVLEMTSTDNLCFGIIYGDIDFNEKTFKIITSKTI